MTDVAGLVREGQRLLAQSKLSSTHRTNAGLKALALLPALLSLAEQHEEQRRPSRGEIAGRFRDWLHETPMSKCRMGTDECPDWPLAYELADMALRAEEDAETAYKIGDTDPGITREPRIWPRSRAEEDAG